MITKVSNEKKISIIVAIYNSEKFLEKLLLSIINQTYSNIEVILVDDGSPDKSGDICDRFAEKDNRIKVIHKKNGGTCDARNAGLGVVTGDYLMIVDGDDWLEDDCVEYLYSIAESTKSDMSMSVNVFTTRDRNQIENDEIEVWSAEKATAAIIYPYLTLGPWNKLYSSRLIKDNGIDFSVPWFGEGLYFASTAAQHANQVGIGHKKIYNYRLNNAGSGLTVYKVQNGINALLNIKGIKDNLYIDTDVVHRAVDWHLWKNYTFLLLQIIGSNSVEQYKSEYNESINEIKKNWRRVFIKSAVSKKEKLKILVCGMAPILYTKAVIYKKRVTLARDLKNFEETI